PRDLHSFPTRRSSDLVPRPQNLAVELARRGQVVELCPTRDDLDPVRQPCPPSRPHGWHEVNIVGAAVVRQPKVEPAPDLRNESRSEEHTSELQSRENL